MRNNLIQDSGFMPYIIELRNSGKKLKEIQEYLLKEKHFDVSVQTLSRELKKYFDAAKVQDDNNSSNAENSHEEVSHEEYSPQDILYDNRKEVIKMKKEFYANFAIAKRFNVSEQDVYEFLSKRKRLSPQQYREIIYKSSKGVTAQELADEYGVNVRSIEAFLEKNPVLTTSTRVVSNYENNYEPQDTSIEFDEVDIVKNFVKLVQNIEIKYKNASDDIDKFDNTRNDIYHKLELGDFSQEEKLAMLDKIGETSVERRKLKDFIELIQPLIDYLQENDNKLVLKNLGNIVAQIMNKMSKMESRVYFMRETSE